MVFVVAGAVLAAYEHTVVCIFCFDIVGRCLLTVAGVSCTVVDMSRPLAAVSQQIAVSTTVVAENEVHLIFCTLCIAGGSVTVSNDISHHLLCAVIS